MIRLYHRLTSGNSYKARLLLSILQLEYEPVAIELERGRNKVDEAYLRLNPRGQIPTLVDDEFVLWGSTAILFYLARKYDAEQCWLPVEARPASEIMQWLELAQNECNTGLFLARAIRRFGYAEDISTALRDGRKALDVLEGRLRDREWLVLQHATIADLACFPYAALASEGDFQLSDWPAVQSWIGSIRRLEGFIGMPGITGPEHFFRPRAARKYGPFSGGTIIMTSDKPALIRPYRDTDYVQVVDLFTRINRELAPLEMRERFEQCIQASIDGEINQLLEIFSEAKRNAFWVVEAGDKIIGMFGIESRNNEARSSGACILTGAIVAAASRNACCCVPKRGRVSSAS